MQPGAELDTRALGRHIRDTYNNKNVNKVCLHLDHCLTCRADAVDLVVRLGNQFQSSPPLFPRWNSGSAGIDTHPETPLTNPAHFWNL